MAKEIEPKLQTIGVYLKIRYISHSRISESILLEYSEL